MKIIREELISTLDDLFGPYPSFSGPGTWTKTMENLMLKHKEDIKLASDEFTDYPEAVYEDIHDDINNCGRDPLAKFIEQVEQLVIVRELSPDDFNIIMDYLVDAINSKI